MTSADQESIREGNNGDNVHRVHYCVVYLQARLKASLAAEVAKGNEPFMTLPQHGLGQDEIRGRLQYKVRFSQALHDCPLSLKN